MIQMRAQDFFIENCQKFPFSYHQIHTSTKFLLHISNYKLIEDLEAIKQWGYKQVTGFPTLTILANKWTSLRSFIHHDDDLCLELYNPVSDEVIESTSAA